MAEKQADRKPEPTITVAKIALLGAIGAALVGAAATITVALLQRTNPVPTPVPVTAPESTRRVFDQSALDGDNGVRKVLINSYGIRADQIQSVQCPANQEVKAGNRFTCTVRLSGDSRKEQVVDITVRGDTGEYEVGTPHDR